MTDKAHLACPNEEDCGSSDAYSHNFDKGVGYCHSCGIGTWVYNSKLYGKYSRQGKSVALKGDVADSICEKSNNKSSNTKSYNQDPWVYEDDEEEEEYFVTKDIKEVDTSKGEYVARRGITTKTMEFFGVKQYKDQKWAAKNPDTEEYESGMSHEEVHFPLPSGGYKIRRMDIPKEHFAHFSNTGKGDSLFGANLFPAGCSKTLVITEGEFDAMAAWQMLSANNSYVNAVVSLPSATPSAKFWKQNDKYFNSFEKIILSVDNDKKGKEFVKKFADIYSDSTFILEHEPYKDANDFLQAGQGKEYKNRWWNAKKYRPEFIISDVTDFLRVFEESPNLEFFPTGIPELDQKLGGGISKGYITLIQAKTGVGKTQLVRMLEYSCWRDGKFSFATKHLEETHKESLLGLVSYDLNDRLIDKSEIEEKGKVEEVKASIEKLTKDGRIVFYDIDPADSNDDIMKKFKYLVAAMNVDYIFLEPVQDAVAGSSASEKEGRISDLVTRMGNLCGETGVGFVVIAHENSDGGAMYSSMITKKAGFKIVLTADRESEDLTVRNKTFIKVQDKNRSGRGFGPAGVVDFEYETYTLKPDIKHEPVIERPSENKEEIPF